MLQILPSFHTFTIVDLVHSISRVTVRNVNSACDVGGAKLDADLLQLLNREIRHFIAKLDSQPKPRFSLVEVGNALIFLSGSRYAKDMAKPSALLMQQLVDLIVAPATSLKVGHLLNRVMRKKIAFRVMQRYLQWLQSLEQSGWERSWSSQQIEQLIEITDPGKDFLFICRTLAECSLLANWLTQLNLCHETEWRLHLNDCCYSFAGSHKPTQQISDEVSAKFLEGKIKNLAAPRGAARGKHSKPAQTHLSDLNNIKCFHCDVIVRWDDMGNGEKRRNQLLVGLLKTQLLWWKLHS